MIYWTPAITLLLTVIISTVHAAPTRRDAPALLENAREAQKQNAAFQTLKETDSCSGDEKACIEGAVAACQGGKWAVAQGKCSRNQICFALPSVRGEGTLVTCTSEKNALEAFEAAGADGGIFGEGNGKSGNETSSSSESSDNKSSCESADGDGDAGCPASTGGNGGATETTSVDSEPSTESRIPTSVPTSPPRQTSESTRPTSSASTSRQAAEPTQPTALPPSASDTLQETVTVTVTLDGSTSLPPTTRTLSPQEASSVLSSLMANGATIIESPPTPTPDVLTASPTSTLSPAAPSSESSPVETPRGTPGASNDSPIATESAGYLQ